MRPIKRGRDPAHGERLPRLEDEAVSLFRRRAVCRCSFFSRVDRKWIGGLEAIDWGVARGGGAASSSSTPIYPIRLSSHPIHLFTQLTIHSSLSSYSTGQRQSHRKPARLSPCQPLPRFYHLVPFCIPLLSLTLQTRLADWNWRAARLSVLSYSSVSSPLQPCKLEISGAANAYRSPFHLIRNLTPFNILLSRIDTARQRSDSYHRYT